MRRCGGERNFNSASGREGAWGSAHKSPKQGLNVKVKKGVFTSGKKGRLSSMKGLESVFMGTTGSLLAELGSYRQVRGGGGGGGAWSQLVLRTNGGTFTLSRRL